jgi:hypothetical protein
MKTLTSEVGDTLVLASILSSRLQDFLSPLLIELDQVLDRRLVKTFAATLSLLLEQRYRATGLLLSELGAFLGGFSHAPAGTKRLSNLLRSPRWSSAVLEDFLWCRAEQHLRDLICRGHDALLLWDESVWEKPESIALEGLGSVRSAHAACLKRSKRGFYTPPGPPVFVPGLQWLSLLLLGRSGPPVLAKMRGWTPGVSGLTPAGGRSRGASASPRASSRCRAHVSGSGRTGASCCRGSASPTPSSSACSSPNSTHSEPRS